MTLTASDKLMCNYETTCLRKLLLSIIPSETDAGLQGEDPAKLIQCCRTINPIHDTGGHNLTLNQKNTMKIKVMSHAKQFDKKN